jgi:hypothetical protein
MLKSRVPERHGNEVWKTYKYAAYAERGFIVQVRSVRRARVPLYKYAAYAERGFILQVRSVRRARVHYTSTQRTQSDGSLYKYAAYAERGFHCTSTQRTQSEGSLYKYAAYAERGFIVQVCSVRRARVHCTSTQRTQSEGSLYKYAAYAERGFIVCKTPPLIPILSHTNWVHTMTCRYTKIRLIFPSTPSYPQASFR